MGKPIAGRDKSPFGVNGINVDAAVLQDGTKLKDVRISKQRSSSMFDLLSADGKTVYKFVSLTGLDKDGKLLDTSNTNTQLSNKLAPGTFCISAVGVDGKEVGFAIKLQLNKINLQDGTVLYITDYNNQGEVVVKVTGVTLTPSSLALAVGASSNLTATVAPQDATNKDVSYTSSSAATATVSASGVVKAIANGTANITVKTNDGSFTAVTSVTVSTAVESIAFNNTTANVAVGSSVEQSTTITPSTASNLNRSFNSSDTNIATVAAKSGSPHVAVITGVAAGTAVITVSTEDGAKTSTITVTVA